MAGCCYGETAWTLTVSVIQCLPGWEIVGSRTQGDVWDVSAQATAGREVRAQITSSHQEVEGERTTGVDPDRSGNMPHSDRNPMGYYFRC